MSARADLLARVNSAVNALPYKTDFQIYGQPDFWERISTAGVGDCEDFALEKRARLVEAGVPLADLRLALCFTETGDSHAILIAADPDEGGDWVLDNRQPSILTLDDLRGLGYRGGSLQVPGQFLWAEWKI
jgi:predicted transglutaminase-like cysteine proteinase